MSDDSEMHLSSLKVEISEIGAIKVDIPTALVANPKHFPHVSRFIGTLIAEFRKGQTSLLKVERTSVSCQVPSSAIKSPKQLTSFVNACSHVSNSQPNLTVEEARQSVETASEVLDLQRNLISACVNVAQTAVPSRHQGNDDNDDNDYDNEEDDNVDLDDDEQNSAEHSDDDKWEDDVTHVENKESGSATEKTLPLAQQKEANV